MHSHTVYALALHLFATGAFSAALPFEDKHDVAEAAKMKRDVDEPEFIYIGKREAAKMKRDVDEPEFIYIGKREAAKMKRDVDEPEFIYIGKREAAEMKREVDEPEFIYIGKREAKPWAGPGTESVPVSDFLPEPLAN